MKLRRYCVTVTDKALMREFWTLEGAKNFYRAHRSCAYLYQWYRGEWSEMLAPYIHRDLPANQGAG